MSPVGVHQLHCHRWQWCWWYVHTLSTLCATRWRRCCDSGGIGNDCGCQAPRTHRSFQHKDCGHKTFSPARLLLLLPRPCFRYCWFSWWWRGGDPNFLSDPSGQYSCPYTKGNYYMPIICGLGVAMLRSSGRSSRSSAKRLKLCADCKAEARKSSWVLELR